MRVAFSGGENEGFESDRAHHFGRCPYYIFVDAEGEKVANVKTKENPFYNSHDWVLFRSALPTEKWSYDCRRNRFPCS